MKQRLGGFAAETDAVVLDPNDRRMTLILGLDFNAGSVSVGARFRGIAEQIGECLAQQINAGGYFGNGERAKLRCRAIGRLDSQIRVEKCHTAVTSLS